MAGTQAKPSSGADPRERILAAAERLFARKGVEKTSTREITAEAGVNVASINYYFRTKNALAEEIFVRLAERATTMRLTELSDMRSAHARRKPLRVDALVECFLRPYFEPLESGQLFARFILQHRLQPTEMTQRVYEQALNPFALEFIDALCLLDTRVPKTEWIWRYTLMAGTVQLAITDATAGNRLATLSKGMADAARGDELRANLTKFLCAAVSGKSSDST
jgi:AcrR family transcriptional regulator